ncbi:MlaA family lipoprotein [Propionivibrio limicola]|uniref:MlaA family lipoprotein n=1 Tax=Propionivibrio limicola TaxID=167645 RepID=UPI001292B96E|nr:VacJ family lipoprotein [Propionivibrio limicola]
MNRRFLRSPKVRKVLAATAGILLFGGLSGCATTAGHPKDPLESFNRAMFAVNEGLDVVIKPVAKGYDEVMPSPVKAGVGNFFGNIGDAWISINNLLQGKPVDACSDVARVLVNSTFGVAGLFDVATDFGLEKHAEDFGQTLAVWGVGDGPYFFWPVIGPRTMRDTFGWAIDSYVDPVWNIDQVDVRNTLAGVRFIDVRASLLPADKVIEEAAFDKYDYIRNAYLQNRRSVIHDGNPPRLEDDE